MELVMTDPELDLSESISFAVQFNLVPAVTLVGKPEKLFYMIGAEPLELSMPTYETYPIKDKIVNL